MKADARTQVKTTVKMEPCMAPHLKSSSETLFDRLISHQSHLALIGLSPESRALAIEFCQEMTVLAYDDDTSALKESRSTLQSILAQLPQDQRNLNLSICEEVEAIKDAELFILHVDTEVDDSNTPDLNNLKRKCAMISKCLKAGDYVIFTSSMYPGCIEEMCIPILEEHSKLRLNLDFKVGYVPLRSAHDSNGIKAIVPLIISASDETASHELVQIYGHLALTTTHIASSIKVAEAARLLLHTQRDVNIAFLNEFALIMSASGVNSAEVIETALSQEDFVSYEPGLVGGISTGLDSYYLLHQARKKGVDAELIRSSRMVNDWMPFEWVNRCEQALESVGKSLHTARILVKGISYKENVRDVRNSKAVELCKIFELKGALVDIEDPIADAETLKRYYGLTLQRKVNEKYDLVVIAVKHAAYRSECAVSLRPLFKDKGIICDIRNALRHVDDEVIKVAL